MLKGSLIALQGTVIAQGIGFLFLPLLTRIYSPGEFGSFQVYMSVLMLVLVAASLRYEVALLNAQKGNEERAVLRLCCALNVLAAGAIAGAAFVLFGLGFADERILLPGVPLALLATGVLGGGLFQTLGYVILREQALGVNAAAKILQVSAYCLLALALGYLSYSGPGLIASDVASRTLAGCSIAAWMLAQRRHYFSPVPFDAIQQAARKFHSYPLYTVPGGLLSTAIGSSVPLFMLAAFGEETMGQYALVERSVLMPAAVLSQSVAQAFTASLSASIVTGARPVKEFRRLVLIMSAIGALPAIILSVFGEPLFENVFGSQWREAGEIAQIAAVMLVATMATQPVNMTLLILGRQRQQLTWEASRLGAILLAWITAVHFGFSPATAIAVHTTVVLVMSAVFLWLSDRALRSPPVASG